DSHNNGLFTVQSVSSDGKTLTLTVSGVLTTESPDANDVNFKIPRSYRVVVPSFNAGPGASLTFAQDANGDKIKRGDGLAWADEGFIQGATILVAGTGTKNAGLYTIKSLSADTLVLTAAKTVTAETVTSSTTLTEQGVIRFGASFDATKVDFNSDTISFATPHGFETGDPVRLYTSGNPAIGRLDPTKTYYVRKIDATTIKLAATLADAVRTPTSFVPTSSVVNGTNHTLTLSGFTDTQYVTYHAPAPTTFTPRQVAENYDDLNNPPVTVNNTIYLAKHTFQTGDLSTFTANGSATPIPGLTSGNTYYVTRKDANTVQLSAYNKVSGIVFTQDSGGDKIKWS